MKNHLKYILPFFAASTVYATPTLNPKDLNVLSQIQNSTTSNVLADGQDQNLIWVTPPTVGETATISPLQTKSSNLALCKELRNIQDISVSISKDMQNILKLHADFVKNIETSGLEAKVAEEKIKSHSLQTQKQMERFRQLQNGLLDTYSHMISIEGGKATIRFTSKWEKNIENLRKDNPNLKFARLPVTKTILLPQVARPVELGFYSQAPHMEFESYPEALQAETGIPLHIACPQAYPELFDLPNPINKEVNISMMATYDYQTELAFNTQISYNPAKSMAEIQSLVRAKKNISMNDLRQAMKNTSQVSLNSSESAEFLSAIEQEVYDSVLWNFAKQLLKKSGNRSGVWLYRVHHGLGGALVLSNIVPECDILMNCEASQESAQYLTDIFEAAISDKVELSLESSTRVERRSGLITRTGVVGY